YGIAWHNNGKIYVTSALSEVSIFNNTANGNVAPMKSISGSATLLNRPIGIGVAAGGRIFVVNGGTPSVTAYRRFALLSPGNNNVSPVRNVTGTNTQLSVPWGIAVR
ncbi:MAG TPA: hypothetical protein VEW74_08120, partial [Candidatus Nitrosotalea sp.]|nr:hypothetical protein [Candidatus Nitrosotalea sp.]